MSISSDPPPDVGFSLGIAVDDVLGDDQFQYAVVIAEDMDVVDGEVGQVLFDDGLGNGAEEAFFEGIWAYRIGTW